MITRARWKFAIGFAVAMLVACHPRAMPAVPSEPGSTTPTPLPKPAREMPATAVPGDLLTWGINFANPPIVPYQGTLNWTPVQVPSLKNVIAISGGDAHSLALQADGTVWAWGDNEYGQLGDGTKADWICKDGEQRCYPGPADHTTLSVQVVGLSGVTAVSAGASHSLALKADGSVWAWGVNRYGELGDGSTINRQTPVRAANLTGIVAIAAGRRGQSLALQADGSVWVWGNNESGQLGLGNTTPYSTPVPLPGLKDVVAIATGNNHSLALKSDGTVWTWGNNSAGQLGDGSTTNHSRPVQVIGLKDVVAIAGGGAHSLALKSDGTVWSWGDNEHGQLGDGTTANHPTPAKAGGLSDVIAIAAGDSHSLALKSDGTVWDWGDNASGQLDDGVVCGQAWHYSRRMANGQSCPMINWLTQEVSDQRLRPAQAIGVRGVAAISAGALVSLAIVAHPIAEITPTPAQFSTPILTPLNEPYPYPPAQATALNSTYP